MTEVFHLDIMLALSSFARRSLALPRLLISGTTVRFLNSSPPAKDATAAKPAVPGTKNQPIATKKPESAAEAARHLNPEARSAKQKTSALPIDFTDISRAQVAIRGGVKRTSCEKSHFLSDLLGANIYFKFEFRQFTGSFKERGARNAILKAQEELGNDLKGVIAASAGNHALALAHHGQLLGVPVTVVMPSIAPLAKVDKCRVSHVQVSSLQTDSVLFLILTFLHTHSNSELASLLKVATLERLKSLLRTLVSRRTSNISMAMMILPFCLEPEQSVSRSLMTSQM